MTIFLCVSSIPIPPVSLFSSLYSLWPFIPSVLLLFPALECGSFSLPTWKSPLACLTPMRLKKKTLQVASVAQAVFQRPAAFVDICRGPEA